MVKARAEIRTDAMSQSVWRGVFDPITCIGHRQVQHGLERPGVLVGVWASFFIRGLERGAPSRAQRRLAGDAVGVESAT